MTGSVGVGRLERIYEDSSTMQGKDEHFVSEILIASEIQARLRITNLSFLFFYTNIFYIWRHELTTELQDMTLVLHHPTHHLGYCHVTLCALSTGHLESFKIQNSFQLAKQHFECI